MPLKSPPAEGREEMEGRIFVGEPGEAFADEGCSGNDDGFKIKVKVEKEARMKDENYCHSLTSPTASGKHRARKKKGCGRGLLDSWIKSRSNIRLT